MTWLLLLAHQMQNSLSELGVKASLELAVFTRKPPRPMSLHSLRTVHVAPTNTAAEPARSQVPADSSEGNDNCFELKSTCPISASSYCSLLTNCCQIFFGFWFLLFVFKRNQETENWMWIYFFFF